MLKLDLKVIYLLFFRKYVEPVSIVPDELREKMRQSQSGKDLKIEDKMSLREKAKSKKRIEEMEDRLFYEKTGIKDLSKDYSMENLIKKYEHDMLKFEKKF